MIDKSKLYEVSITFESNGYTAIVLDANEHNRLINDWQAGRNVSPFCAVLAVSDEAASTRGIEWLYNYNPSILMRRPNLSYATTGTTNQVRAGNLALP